MSQLTGWTKEGHSEQNAWAVNYLYKKGFSPIIGGDDPYKNLFYMDETFKSDPTYALEVRNMKAAWRQKKSREKRKGKTEFSLVISNEKKNKLRALSRKKGKTLNETLEGLIDDEMARHVDYQKKLADEKKLLRQKLEMARGAQVTRLNEVELTTDALMYLLNEYVEKMIHYEVDALKANHPLIHDHHGTADYKESRLSYEREAINRALHNIPAWKKRTYPLDIGIKMRIKGILNIGGLNDQAQHVTYQVP